MAIIGFDHVNLRTARLTAMKEFYTTLLELRDGPRPAFAFGGAWLYCGSQAVVHLVEIPAEEPPPAAPRLEHFAFRASGIHAFVERLRARGIRYELGELPGWDPTTQVNFHDPDGNHLHVDFPEPPPS